MSVFQNMDCFVGLFFRLALEQKIYMMSFSSITTSGKGVGGGKCVSNKD